jgi:hypothetical protein
MKKAEMNKTQLADRAFFVERLSKAGWRKTLFNEQFDQGLWISPEASMEHSGKDISLRFDFLAEDPRLILYVDATGGKELGLVFRCPDRIRELVEAVIAMQDSVTAANVKKHAEQLIEVCPRMFKISASGDKEIPVKPGSSR